MRSVYIETYGCQMNVADSELVASILRQAGYRIIPTPEEAEVILLNTCAVREHAEERVIGRASQLSGLRAHTPKLTLGILGCMAQHLAETLPQRAPFVDLVMGPDSYRRLPQLLAETAEETLLDLRLDREEDYQGIDPIRRQGVNAWVTIMRGCDRFCTFCIVPFVRGRERSVPAGEILRQVRVLTAEGYREVTLLGQTVNSYRDGQVDFAGLLRAVGQVDGLKRLRFTSPHPADFTPQLIDALAEIPQVCPGLHLPLQSGSDAQLERMRRGYTAAQYRALVAELRQRLPGLALTTDIIAGFCGESEEDFQQTLDLVGEIRFDSAFMFKYSPREGTFAHKKLEDDVPEATKTQRLERVIALQEGISWEINQQLVGQTVEVLVEGPSKRQNGQTRTFYGRSPQGKTVVFSQEVVANALVQVHIERASSHTLFGELAEP
ncbi:MAG: tRNA (N6-isopentenyl adenosine(37)-C2)-methylthiotransferase MiaB [Candidatus Latescibacteria bacterium]|nr:tRNA (N6-isopentenyl adenosine(37)-C2)-methylthiotransferase MiaB [Candidatus Latescibacterota bacterium]